MTYQNLWHAVKAVIRGKIIPLQTQLRKQEKFQLKKLTLYLKELENEEQKQPKVSKGKIKLREVNEIENKKTIQKCNTTKSWLFEKINKIDNPLTRLTKER